MSLCGWGRTINADDERNTHDPYRPPVQGTSVFTVIMTAQQFSSYQEFLRATGRRLFAIPRQTGEISAYAVSEPGTTQEELDAVVSALRAAQTLPPPEPGG